MRPSFLLLLVVALVGCNRDRKPGDAAGPTEAGPGNYCQLGPVGLSVESARLGRIRMRDMMGRDGESNEDVFTVRTRFKLFDTSTPVKQPALQPGRLQFGGAGLKLADGNGQQFKLAGLIGFGESFLDRSVALNARDGDAVLSAESPEAADVLTFQSTAGAVGDLTLEVPANYQVKQPDGTFLQPKEPGTFRFRIPRAMWDARPPPTTEAGPGNWATVGPVSVAVEGVRVGRVKIRGIRGEGESKENVFAVSVRVKLADPAARVKKPPFIPDGIGASFLGPSVTLKSRTGEAFPALVAFGFDKIVGRQASDVELSAEKPEFADLLTFDAKAASADELFLMLWPKWQERKPDGSWADAPFGGEFRFRIPEAAWAR